MVAKSFNSFIALCNYIILICISITSILSTQILLISGDIETKPGPKKSSVIKFCHWNLNGLAAHDFVQRLSLLRTISTLYACLKLFQIQQYLTMMKILILKVTILTSRVQYGQNCTLLNGIHLKQVADLRQYKAWLY